MLSFIMVCFVILTKGSCLNVHRLFGNPHSEFICMDLSDLNDLLVIQVFSSVYRKNALRHR